MPSPQKRKRVEKNRHNPYNLIVAAGNYLATWNLTYDFHKMQYEFTKNPFKIHHSNKENRIFTKIWYAAPQNSSKKEYIPYSFFVFPLRSSPFFRSFVSQNIWGATKISKGERIHIWVLWVPFVRMEPGKVRIYLFLFARIPANCLNLKWILRIILAFLWNRLLFVMRAIRPSLLKISKVFQRIF